MKFNHPLMHNNFTKSDMQSVQKLLKRKILFSHNLTRSGSSSQNGQNG